MRAISILATLSALLKSTSAEAQPSTTSPLSFLKEHDLIKRDGKSLLIATAIYTNSKNNSALQCWEFTTPFSVSTGGGTVGAETFKFVDLANMTYTHIPPHFAGGIHNAPAPQ
jgi:hypothetical protein